MSRRSRWSLVRLFQGLLPLAGLLVLLIVAIVLLPIYLAPNAAFENTADARYSLLTFVVMRLSLLPGPVST